MQLQGWAGPLSAFLDLGKAQVLPASHQMRHSTPLPHHVKVRDQDVKQHHEHPRQAGAEQVAGQHTH